MTEAASRVARAEDVRAASREETETAWAVRAIRAAVTETVRAASREETETAPAARAETVPRVSQAVPADLTGTEGALAARAARAEDVRADFRGETGIARAAGSRARAAAVPVPADVPSQAVPVRRTFPSPLTRQWLQNHRATEAIKTPIRMINTTRGI